MARPRADDYDDKRKAILKTSAALFAEHGFDRASMNQIAQGCGVSKALLYHYYANKDALLFDIIRDHLDELNAAVEEASAPAAPGEARLEACVGALLDAYRDANAEHKIQINEMKRLPPEQQEELKERERQLVKVFAAALADAVPALGGGSELLKPVTMSLFGMVNWHYMWFREGGPVSREDYARIATRLILDGARSLAG
ncbi:TetR/AcrR family transcriptional regulator [Stappia taiwanensis]|uniref:TetR/AcrR family transcriptional regulator n=1 Tax=Stappia taiwanensis TaxID=992267 RepID=A0A838XY55_9HYPH|nr:TetR/AcrR family transcriptional regulator [Stappia taiwanensis]MBA4611710.1 TetR/AcrR family transcriptional regulator [Stappia taiwanensis]GGE97407.1 TetR family transcriptional regulator [Stappia taiwanensis]